MKIIAIVSLLLMALTMCFNVNAATDILTAARFDMNGTITAVLTPSSILVGKEKVNLEGVDPSGLDGAYYLYLMRDLTDWLIGKDVFVKGEYVYFDLNGAYNSISINEMIQKEIRDLEREQYCEYYGQYCY